MQRRHWTWDHFWVAIWWVLKFNWKRVKKWRKRQRWLKCWCHSIMHHLFDIAGFTQLHTGGETWLAPWRMTNASLPTWKRTFQAKKTMCGNDEKLKICLCGLVWWLQQEPFGCSHTGMHGMWSRIEWVEEGCAETILSSSLAVERRRKLEQ